MSKFSPTDKAKTLERMLRSRSSNRENQVGSSWLRHEKKRGYTIDHLLLFGATMDELVKLSDSKNEASVRGHFQHLQVEHHLPISLNRDGLYIFDIQDFDESEDEEFENAANDNASDEDKANFVTEVSEQSEVDCEKVNKIEPKIDAGTEGTSEVTKQCWGAVLSDDSSVFKILYGEEAILSQANKDLTSVLVVLSGPKFEVIKVALETMVELLSDLQNPELWKSGYLAKEKQYYVYQHYDKNGVFYVGKGTKVRAFDHVKDAKEAWLSSRDKPKTHKHRRILNSIVRESMLSDELFDAYKTDHIRSFLMPDVPHGEMMSFLAEDVLITNQYGVYNLTNETGGNNKSDGYIWLTQPMNSSITNGGWAAALKYFLVNRRLSSDARAHITAINAHSLMKSGKTIINDLSELITVQGQDPIKVGQDIFVDLAFEKLAFRIQLLFSSKNPTVKLNLRPARNANGNVGANESNKFRIALKNVLNANPVLDWKLRIPNDNNCYVKPFWDMDKPGKDPAFNILDEEMRCNVKLVGDEIVLSYNLVEAVRRIQLLFENSKTQ